VVKILRSDHGGEYRSTAFIAWLTEKGIEQQFTMPDSPQQNGVAERYNRTLIEGVRSMIHGSGMTLGFWGEAVLCFNYTRNRLPTSGRLGSRTPHEVWTGNVPTIGHLRPFGCPCSVHIVDSQRRKLDAKSWLGTMVLGFKLAASVSSTRGVVRAGPLVVPLPMTSILEKKSSI